MIYKILTISNRYFIAMVAVILSSVYFSYCSNIKTNSVKSESKTAIAYGCIEGDCRNGIGTYLWENGSKYIGQFKNRLMNGQGTFYFGEKSISPDSKYIGEFKNDFIDGYGIWTWSNGDKYIGECKQNKMHGKGTYYYSDGTAKKGSWFNDKYVEEIPVLKSDSTPEKTKSN
jgi:hypothetical protein